MKQAKLFCIIPDFALGFEENGLTFCQDKACEQKNRRRTLCSTSRTLLRAKRSHGKKLETFYRNPNANSGIIGIIFLVYFLSVVSFCVYAEEAQPENSLKVEYTSSDLRDPFERQLPEKQEEIAPQQVEEIKAPEITVDGLVAGGPVPQAIIGGEIFRMGDKVGEAVIVNITKEGVDVLYMGKTFSFPAPSKALMPIKGGEDVK